MEQKEELEQKHLHIIQILESERQAKWHYVQQTEELVAEVKKLKAEVHFRPVHKEGVRDVIPPLLAGQTISKSSWLSLKLCDEEMFSGKQGEVFFRVSLYVLYI